MALAAPQPVERSDSQDWLPIDEAARLTGEQVRTLRWRAKVESDAAQREGRRSLAVKRLPPSARGKRMWWVHRSIDKRLSLTPTAEERADRARESLLSKGYAEHAVTLAYKRAFWLHRWQDACRRRRDPSATALELAETIVSDARQAEGDALSTSVRTLQRWEQLYNTLGPDGQIRGVAALIDGRAVAKRLSDDAETSAPQGRSPDAVAYFHSLYHCQSQPSVKFCHELTAREARQRGWEWSASYGATRKWLAAHDSVSVSYLLREGKDAWCRRYMPHNEIDYTLIEPGQLYQTDHHQCDFWVEHDGKQIRPWLTLTEDARSRAVVGWHLGPSPHQDAIAANYLMAFLRWAIPETLRIDNGKDYTSRLLVGVTKAERDRLRREYGRDWQRVIRRDANLVDCVDPRFMGITQELGIECVYAIPYSPWSKGQTERLFGTFESRCGKTFATYCGRSSLNRPECLDTIRRGYTKDQKRRLRKRHGRDWKKIAVLRLVDQSAVPTLDEARTAVDEWATEYHHTVHSADDMAGMTPLEMWQTASSLRRADDRALLFLMQARGVYRVGPNGVAFKVGGARLTYGAGNPSLYPYDGRDVFISLDPNDLSCCYAFTPDRDRRFIGKLDANKRISPMASVDELRDANAAVGRRRKVMHRAEREAPARMRTATEEMAAKRRERSIELRATGTDDVTAHTSIVPVQTGFEGAIASVAKTARARVDRKSRDLSAAAKALTFGHDTTAPEEPRRPRMTLDMIVPVTDDGMEAGTDAERPKPDLLGLVAGNRHERTERIE